TLPGVSITDPKISSLACTPLQPATLLAGQSMTCTGIYVIQSADIANGSITNTATANRVGSLSVTASTTIHKESPVVESEGSGFMTGGGSIFVDNNKK